MACWINDEEGIIDQYILPSCLEWYGWHGTSVSVMNGQAIKYHNQCTSTLCSHAFEYKWPTIFIHKDSDICITYKRLNHISPL